MFTPDCAADEELVGVVIAIPEPWVSELTDLRIRVGDALGKQTPAHITVIPPTPVKIADRTLVVEHLQQVASRMQPFRIVLDSTGTFRPVSPVVFVNVTEGAHSLRLLEREVGTGVLDYPRRFDYHPHVTLAQGVSDAQLDRAQRQCAGFHAEWVTPGIRLDHVTPDGRYVSRALVNFTSTH